MSILAKKLQIDQQEIIVAEMRFHALILIFLFSLFQFSQGFQSSLSFAKFQHARLVRMAGDIKVVKASPEDIEKMKIKTWATWGCGVSKVDS